MNTDEELYARFLCGEDEALGQLMERYFERLTLFCATFLNSVAEAEEMALDAFAVVALKRAAWHGGSFRSWLYRIARNLSVSRYRTLRFIPVPFDESCPLAASSGTEADFWRREETGASLRCWTVCQRPSCRVLTMIYLETPAMPRRPGRWAWTKRGSTIWRTAAKGGCGNGSGRRRGSMSETVVCLLVAALAFGFGTWRPS